MPTPKSTSALAVLCAAVLLTTGCKPGQTMFGLPAADDAVKLLAESLTKVEISRIPMTGSASDAQSDYYLVINNLEPVQPKVQPGKIDYNKEAKTASAELTWKWEFPGKVWEYVTQAKMVYADGTWKLNYEPQLAHPMIDSTNKMRAKRTTSSRGRILGAGNKPLVEMRDVVRVGIDKSRATDKAVQEDSARKLAKLVEINPDDFATRVAASGEKAFVEAITLRSSTGPSELSGIVGARAIPDKLMLGPYKSFGQPLLGIVSEATKEMIEKSKGEIRPGDVVGVTGLQALHDKTLRGTPGLDIDFVIRSAADPGQPTVTQKGVFQIGAENGKDLVTTLDYDLQAKAEAKIKDEKIETAVTIIQPSTGKILAMATSPNAKDQIANGGQYPPGSTFKIVTSLALIRKGLTPDSKFDCPTQAVVDNRAVKNFDGYPASSNGSITMRDALAHSCNTYYVNASKELSNESLVQAANSLGFGMDHETGFYSFYGSIPVPGSNIERAEDSFGQGKVLGSPMAVTAISASVAAKKTVVPWMIEGNAPKQNAQPLTEDEATKLQDVMGAAASYGSVRGLKGILAGGKTGTAEYGTGDQMKAHLWMTGFTNNDLAITAFQMEGEHSPELAPLIKAILT